MKALILRLQEIQCRSQIMPDEMILNIMLFQFYVSNRRVVVDQALLVSCCLLTYFLSCLVTVDGRCSNTPSIDVILWVMSGLLQQ